MSQGDLQEQYAADEAIPPPKLHWLIRLVLGLAGAALLGLSAYIAFVSRNGTATAALVVAGAVLLVLGGMGRPIRSFRYGGLEVLLEQARAEFRRGNVRRAEELTDAALSLAGLSDVSVESVGRLHESAVLAALQRIEPEAQLKLTVVPVDAKLIVSEAGQELIIGIEAKVSLRRVTLEPLVGRLATRATEGKLDDLAALLVVVSTRGSDQRVDVAEEQLSRAVEKPVRVVRWREGDAEAPLAEALHELRHEWREGRQYGR